MTVGRSPRVLLVCAISLAGILLLSGCRPTTSSFRWNQNRDDWHEFQGTWTATGSRNVMRLGADRRASIANFNGSVVLSGPSRPNVGFRADAIVFSDSNSGMVGRAVWTDEHGDQVFSELKGEGTAARNQIIGNFVGGTGRYAGAAGTYEFSWQFLIENEDGNLQGQSLGLKGRVRVSSPQPESSAGGPRS